MKAITPVYSDLRLKDLAAKKAREEGVPLSELFCRAMTEYLKCDPNLATVPRKKAGRPKANPTPE